jgi:hypothetical protein
MQARVLVSALKDTHLRVQHVLLFVLIKKSTILKLKLVTVKLD